MTENIELHSFANCLTNESDIQEYDEINQDTVRETSGISLFLTKLEKPLNEFDFFTQYDVETEEKRNVKKKKSKKKGKSLNLMDIITSELAVSADPIRKNAISKVEFNVDQQINYLENTPRTRRIYQKRRDADLENGRAQTLQIVNVSPIFPRILENTRIESHDIVVEYVDPGMFCDLTQDNTNQKQISTKFLDITLKNIKFKHHHKFSLEKLLCVKLVELYHEYENIQRLLKAVARDIKVNRETKNNLKHEFLKINPQSSEEIRFDQTIRKYTGKLLQLKERYKDISKKQKEIIHKITSLWSDVLMIREKTRFKDTPYELQVNEIIMNHDFENEWSDLFNVEFTDILDKIEYEYVNKYIEYKEIKNDIALGRSAKKKIYKPKLKINEDVLKDEVEEVVNNMVTTHNIDIILNKDQQFVRDSTECMLNKYKYSFEIYVDDVFVCESDHYSSNDGMLDIEFIEHFSIQMLPNNNSLSVVLLENDVKVSCFKTNLSEIERTNANNEYLIQNFVYRYKIEPHMGFVGSKHSIKEIATANNVRLKSSNIFKSDLCTACVVNVKLEWNDELNKNQCDTIKSSMETGRQIRRLLHGIDKPKLDIMRDIICQIYDRDISKEEKVINTLRDLCKSEIVINDSFPIDENSPENVRKKLLHLRNSGGFTNVEYKMIPIYSSQITTEQLNCLQKSNEKHFDVEYFTGKQTEMDPIELQRFISGKYVERLNKNMLKNLNDHLMKKTHKDVVRDFKDLSLRGLFGNHSNLATLATVSSTTKQQILKESLSKNHEINVTVLRAFNLLDRSATIIEDADEDDRIAGYKVRPLRPFVRVSYHGASAQTVTAIGCHPSWNHTLKMNTKLDPLSSIHVDVYDEYKANITDEHPEEDPSSCRTVHYRYYNKWLGTLQVPLQTVLTLGTLRGTFKVTTPPVIFGYETVESKEPTSLIPEINRLMKKDESFITLYITTSLSHLGGLQEYNQPVPSIFEDDYLIKHLNSFVTEYTNDFPSRNISLTFIDSAGRNKCVTQFLQPIPLPNSDLFPKNPKSCGSAVSKSSGLSKSSSTMSSVRRREMDLERASQVDERESVYSGLGGSWLNGDSISKMVDTCIRYVALIPSYEVTASHAVTLMGVELLKILHGSPLDHTILLASYFLYLGMRCWIVIGAGLPRGLSSYVLIKYDLSTRRIVQTNDRLIKSGLLNKHDGYVCYVCDGVSGEKYELRDVGCPLKTMVYVFDNENIWVNIQTSQDCESVSVDFSRSSDWQPVFDKSIFVMKQAIMTDAGLYSTPPNVEGLRQMLETKIKGKVQKWRPHMKTIWNRYCSALLREMLPHWEYWAFNSSENKPAPSPKLKQMMVTYKIFGFPLNMPFVNTKSVVSSVKSTALHVTDEANAEFALGVEVYPYPNNVISVWVFFASIIRI